MPTPDDDELGLTGLITTDRWLALAGGLLGGVITCLGLLIKTSRHLNRTARSHRP